MSASTNYPTIRPSLLLDFANTEQLDPRITFARSTTATYYDDNTVAMAEQNLLPGSGDVAAYTQIFGIASRTANATTAPDGTTTAGLVTVNSSTGRHWVGSQRGGIAAIGSTVTGSVFLKAGTYGFASVQLSNATNSAGGGRYAISVDLSNGMIGGFTGSVGVIGQTSSVTNVGNGWYRVVLTMTTTVAGDGDGLNILVSPMPTNGSGYPDGTALLPSFTGDGTSGIYVWGVQCELRSTVTAYTPTTTQPITNYIPVLMTAAINEARLDHNPTTRESLGLLIEESRTNLLTYSSEFDNGAWGKTAASIVSNTIIAPDGTLTGDNLIESTATSAHRVLQSVSGVSVPATQSVYVKYAGRRYFQIYTADNTTNYVTFDVQYGTITRIGSSVVSSSIQSCGNGWYRCTATYSSVSGAFYYGLADVGTAAYTPSYTGDGYSGVYIWGAQLEAGSFPTSYIPTVASQVTRSADSASMTGSNFSSWYRADEGTLYAEGAGYSVNNSSLFVLRDSTTGYINQITLDRAANNVARFSGNYQGTVQYSISTGNFNAGTVFKLAGGYAANNFAASFNGSTVSTDLSGSVPISIVQAEIGRLGQSQGEYVNGTIKRIAYYPARLTNAQLQAITS